MTLKMAKKCYPKLFYNRKKFQQNIIKKSTPHNPNNINNYSKSLRNFNNYLKQKNNNSMKAY